jgi:hypothetical protein
MDVDVWSDGFLWVNFVGGWVRAGNLKHGVHVVFIRHELRTPTLIIAIRLLCYLFTATFYVLAGFRNQESRSRSHFIRRLGFISNFERRGFV